MYHSIPSLVLGFHGCDREVGESVLSGKTDLKPSRNDYDWLGHGIYFWEHNPRRALEFAEELKQFDPKKKIKEPFVIGAVIDLGRCLDLLDSKAIGIVKSGYESVKNAYERLQAPLPQNKPLRGSKDLILRRLDCASVEAAHQIMQEAKEPSYDNVRGTFVEGDPLYENSGFYAKTHIQLCVRNARCIKGYFRVRDLRDHF